MRPGKVSCAIALSFVLSVLGEAALPEAQTLQENQGQVGPDAAAPADAASSGLKREGLAFSLSSALDQGRVVRTQEGFLLSGRGYRADVAQDGLRFVPTSVPVAGPARARTGELSLALVALASDEGERELAPSAAPTQPGGLFGQAVVTPYAPDGMAQTVIAHPDGVDLGVWLRERPADAGDLRLVFALDASVERLRVETVAGTHEELVFGGSGEARIGRALAIDAAGRRTPLTMRAGSGRLEIELDEALLATASFPLWIDPKLGAVLPISGSPSTRDVDPDTVFDPVTGEFLVVWERDVSASESDIWGARVDAAGALAAGPFPVDVTASTLATRPRIAVDPITGNYLVAYEDQPLAGSRTVRWSLFDSTDVLVASQAFTVSGYLADARPDVGFVAGSAGSSGFVLVHRREALTTPNSTVQVTWVDATTGGQIDSQTVPALSPPRDDLPAVPQLSAGGASLVAFQRFNTTSFILDVRANCIGLGAGSVSIGSGLAVTADASSADSTPDVSVVNGTFQVVWERLVLATSDRNMRGREILPACAGFGGAAFDISSLALLETSPAVVAGRYNATCDGQSLALFTTTNAAGTSPRNVLARRWNSAASQVGPIEAVALGAGGTSYSTPRAALDSGSTAWPRFLVVYDDDGAGSNPAAEVFGQLMTFDGIPLSAVVSPADSTLCAGQPITLSVATTGTGPFTYQWRQDGTPIPGATGPSYTISALTPFDAGTYDVQVGGACGSLLSTSAVIVVDEPITDVTIAVSASPVCAGTDVTLTAGVATGIPDTYTWYRSGTLLQTTTVPSLLLPAVQTTDIGAYTVEAENVCGSSTSATPAVLRVDEPITGLTIAVSASPVCTGTNVTLTAANATGIPTSYGWFRNGNFLQVTTTPSLALFNVQPPDAGSYTVRASNACGTVTSAAPAVLEVDEVITGVTIAVSASPVCTGTSVTFTAATATGVPRNYGWFRDGAFVSATTVPTLVLPAAQLSQAGSYTVRAANKCGLAASGNAADLEVDQTVTGLAIAISASPVCAGSSVTFTASFSAGVADSYGWFRNGTFVQSTTSPTLVLSSAQPANAGSWTVRATNTCGIATSGNAVTLEVDEPITGVSIGVSASPVCAGTSVTFTAGTATGTPRSYGWFRNGTFVKVTSVPTLVLPSAQPSDSGTYTVRAANACGAVASPGSAALLVDTAISGVTIDASASPVCAGTNVTFTAATATGTPSSYDWFRNSVFLQTTAAPTLALTAVQPGDTGGYTVRASNACGASTSAIPAVLQVDQPITSVSIGVSASPVCAGTNVTFTATTTGGTPSTYTWYRGATLVSTTTVPTLALSAVQPSQSGNYVVQVSNACGDLLSTTPANLVVSSAISSVTVTATKDGVCLGGTVVFTADVVGGTAPLLYEWRKDGISLGAPAPSNTLTIASAQAPDAGSYQVIASNPCGSSVSPAVELKVFSSPTLYCTAKPNSLGCASTWTWSGQPSASAGSGFDLTWGPSPAGNFNNAIFIYSTQGPAVTPITSIYGTLCLPPGAIRRMPFTPSGGTPGTCTGFYTSDFNAFAASASAPPDLTAGTTVDLQCWYRDNPVPGGASYSNAISFVLCQ